MFSLSFYTSVVANSSKLKLTLKIVRLLSKQVIGVYELLVSDIPASAANGHEMDMRVNLMSETQVAL